MTGSRVWDGLLGVGKRTGKYNGQDEDNAVTAGAKGRQQKKQWQGRRLQEFHSYFPV
jgi:hypothetical protein